PRKAMAKTLLRLLRNGLQQRERHVLADYGCRLKQPFVFGRETIDARGEDRLGRGGGVKTLDRPGEPVSPAVPRKRPGLHERPDALLEEEGIALRPLDEHPLEIVEPLARPEQRRQ